MHNLYYLTFDGVAFSQDKDEANAADITIYRKYMGPTEDYRLYDELTEDDQFIITTARGQDLRFRL